MPRDKNGEALNVGDLVLVPCRVVNVNPGTDYCNLTVETIEPMHPGDSKTHIVLNTRQVEKAEA